MEEWEYCLLWASPKKTIVVKPGGQVETYSNSNLSGSSEGILVELQTDGWQTAAFNVAPTEDMTYLFRRRVQSQLAREVPEHPLAFVPMPPQTQPTANPPQ